MKIEIEQWKFKYDELTSEMEIVKKQEETFALQKDIIKKESEQKESHLKTQIRQILNQFFMNIMAKQTKINKIFENGAENIADDDNESEEVGVASQPLGVVSNTKGLKALASDLMAEQSSMAWSESFDILPPTPLPFGTNPLDIHDDLKRELAFYNCALEATHEARKKCEESGIPFKRPDDFYAEMVKADDHMAKVKDRLIFEKRKMEAFEQRKSNREHKLRSKEAHAHRIAEKAKTKKQHFKDVEDWAKTAQSNRSHGVHDNDDDEYLNNMNKNPGKKRMASDKKFGFGGKNGRFKKTDKRSLNDLSDYNPRGSGGNKKGAASTKRQGKRARDAAKSRS